ncbi:MAG: Glucosyl-3-phosphoglycerate synthase [Actinomycetia bacterium]|nr:Glucosyl-3-phosphoglycerate synthase [Actinomycetes bacterium]MDQ1651758.1 glucosyl-3-phosphoglycerate synthase [Cryptosporangiaceae bacterium]
MRADAQRWFATRTHRAADWPYPRVAALKEAAALKGSATVSVVLPALNEEPTVGAIVAGVRSLGALVDEVVVVDSGCTDRTAEVAAAAGARVVHRDDVLPELGPSRPGKGEVLWKALQVTSGDLVVYLDADLTGFRPSFVTGLLGPLLADPEVLLVKGFYDRPLGGEPGSGGRVTELLARPLLNLYFPELAGVVQPLAGEYAARRSLLETLPFAPGYGVEAGLLVDTVTRHGLGALAQTDLGERRHAHQDTAALGRMAAAILHTIARRTGDPGPATLTQFARNGGAVTPADYPVPADERPPIASLAQYQLTMSLRENRYQAIDRKIVL